MFANKMGGRASSHCRILVVHYALTPGGASRVAIEDAVMLQRQGFQVGFASATGSWRSKLEQDPVPFFRLYFVDPGRFSAWIRYTIGIVLTAIILLYVVIRYRYDYLYVHHWQSTIPAVLVATLTRIHYVFVAHLVVRHGRRSCWPGKYVIAVSNAVKMDCIARFHLSPDCVTVIPNAVDTQVVVVSSQTVAQFNRLWNIPENALVVTCVALLNEQKAHRVLLDAWQKVTASIPDAILLLAGNGPLRQALEAQCSALKITKSVRFMGMTEELAVLYTRTDLFALSSIVEGMPMTPLEAAVYGVPTVATAVGGTTETVIDGETGLLVEADNDTALAAALLRVLLNPTLRHDLGQKARKFVEQSHSLDSRAQILAEYFQCLMAEHKTVGKG